MLKPFIAKAITRTDLTADEAEQAMTIIMTGQATQAQIGGYLVALRMKGETVAEITGSVRAMRAVAVKVPVSDRTQPVYDIVGTGGDGAHTFNISTAAAFVVAGAGRRVAKHGYFAILPDLYYRMGTVRLDIPRRNEAMTRVVSACMASCTGVFTSSA